jgi:hypothetical protein
MRMPGALLRPAPSLWSQAANSGLIRGFYENSQAKEESQQA